MSTWENASLSGVPERSITGDERPRDAVRNQVLDTAEALVGQHGLTVGLGHLSFDEIINLAGVSRTTAYRVWPRKERFLEDLLRRLADVASPCYGPLDDEAAELAFATLRENVGALETAEGRRGVLVEMCRVTADGWFRGVALSPTWKTYVALIATIRSLGDQELASELRERMEAVDDIGAQRVAGYHKQAMAVLGYRLRQVGPIQLVDLGAATLLGSLLLADIHPKATELLTQTDPFETGHLADWSLPAIAYTSVLLEAVEPDPDYDLEAAVRLLN